MAEVGVVALKGLFGGLLVAAFAVLGHLLRPKWFAGPFVAAPSVAIASVAVTTVDKGHQTAALAAFGMLFGVLGAVALSAFAVFPHQPAGSVRGVAPAKSSARAMDWATPPTHDEPTPKSVF
jgi:hypothetical protein